MKKRLFLLTALPLLMGSLVGCGSSSDAIKVGILQYAPAEALDIARLSFKETLLATSFTGIYAFLFIILNILKIVDGPYPFLQVYKNGVYMSLIWFLLIVGGSFLLSKIIGRIKRK